VRPIVRRRVQDPLGRKQSHQKCSKGQTVRKRGVRRGEWVRYKDSGRSIYHQGAGQARQADDGQGKRVQKGGTIRRKQVVLQDQVEGSGGAGEGEQKEKKADI